MIDHDLMKYDQLCNRYKALLIQLKAVQDELMAMDKQVGRSCTGSNYRAWLGLEEIKIYNLSLTVRYDESDKGE